MTDSSSAAERLASTPDRHPPRERRVVSTLPLLPEDHHRLAQLALDLGIDRQQLVRRALIVAGVLPSEEVAGG